MNYCSNCAAPLVLKIPAGDNLPRYVCEICHTVHYQNPKVVVGCLPEWEGRILLCRRAIEPRYGLWTLPAGFMENGESAEQGALRETYEEARASVHLTALFAVISIPHISQVFMMFRATLADTDYAPGPESLEVALFEESEIPWPQLAFPVVNRVLAEYFQDRRAGRFTVHVLDLIKSGSAAPEFVANKQDG